MVEVPNIELNNGVLIPQVGLGNYKMADKEEFKKSLKWAFEAGYRHIDTAAYYGNEKWLGEAIKESGIDRSDLFITSKLWNSDHGYEETKKAFEDTLERLDLDYLDMYLIHWPTDKYIESWKAMEELKNEGLIRAIGVSNFQIHHLVDLLDKTDVVPAVNQIETHPYFQQDALRAFMKKNGIAHEAWGPLGQGKTNLFNEPVLVKLAEKYDKTVPQIVLRWHTQRGTIIFPKSVHQERLVQNLDLFDFTLTDEDMEAIKTLETGDRLAKSPEDQEFLTATSQMKVEILD